MYTNDDIYVWCEQVKTKFLYNCDQRFIGILYFNNFVGHRQYLYAKMTPL